MWITSRTADSARTTESSELVELGRGLPLPDDVAEWMGMEPVGHPRDDVFLE